MMSKCAVFSRINSTVHCVPHLTCKRAPLSAHAHRLFEAWPWPIQSRVRPSDSPSTLIDMQRKYIYNDCYDMYSIHSHRKGNHKMSAVARGRGAFSRVDVHYLVSHVHAKILRPSPKLFGCGLAVVRLQVLRLCDPPSIRLHVIRLDLQQSRIQSTQASREHVNDT